MSPDTTPKWTLIFLLSAKNNLFMEQLNVIKEIYSVGSSDKVNFVIILDGIGGDKFSDLMEKPHIFFAKRKSDFLTDTHVYFLDKKDVALTNKKNLATLLEYVIDKFPAEKYGFFYKGHGGPGETDLAKGIFDTKMGHIDPAWKEEEIENQFRNSQPGWTFEGYCEYPAVQPNSKNKKPVLLIYSKENTGSLSYADMAEVLHEIFKGKLGFCCLDCCWAQQIENAYNFKNVTEYFIASADEMPALGVGYSELCTHFINRPAISPEEAANLLVAINYYKNYADYDSEIIEFRQMGVSITSTCLTEFEEFLTAFTKLCKKLTDNLKQKDDYTYLIFEAARKNCADYTYVNTENLPADKINYPMFNIDLTWFMENLLFYNVNAELDTLIYDVIYLLKNKLITSFLGSNYKKPVMGTRSMGGKGISICFPINKSHAKISILTSKEMKFYNDSGWKELLKTFYKYKQEGHFKNEENKEEYKIAQKILQDARIREAEAAAMVERAKFVPAAKKEVLKVGTNGKLKSTPA